MGVGELEQRIPVLQRRIAAHQHRALGPEHIRSGVVELRDHHRLAEEPRRHHRGGHIGLFGDRGNVRVGRRQLPVLVREEGMLPVAVIVHVVVSVAHHREQRFGTHVLVGDRAADAEFAHEPLHLLEAGIVDVHQELRELHVIGGSGGEFRLVLFQPFGEPLLVEVGDENFALPGVVDVAFVDQAERNQRRIVFQRHAGIGVDVGEPVARKGFPVLHRGVEQERQRLEGGARQPFVRELRDFPLAEGARHVQIGGHIDAALFAAGDQVVELVELGRVEVGRGGAGALGKPAVVVVQPHRVETGGGHAVCEPLRPLLVEVLGRGAEVGAVETDRHAGAVPELHSAVADHHRAVFAGGSIEAAGEIHRGAGPDVLAIGDLLPVAAGQDVGRCGVQARNLPGTDRYGGDAPHGTAGRGEFQLADRLVFDRVDGAVKPDVGAGVFAGPDQFAVAARGRGPPVADVDVAGDRDFGHAAVIVGDFDRADLLQVRRPRQRVEQIEKIAALTLLFRNGAAREVAARGAGEHDAGFAVVSGRVDDVEFHALPALFADREHPEVILRALIGPAALFVARLVVGESHVRGGAQVERGGGVGLFGKVQFQGGFRDGAACGREADAHHIAVDPVGAVVLQLQLEVAPERDGPLHGRNHQRGDPAAENGGGSAFGMFLGQHDRLAVRQQFPAAETFDRQIGGQADEFQLGRGGKLRLGGILPVAGRRPADRSVQGALGQPAAFEQRLHPAVGGVAGDLQHGKTVVALRIAAPVVVEKPQRERNPFDDRLAEPGQAQAVVGGEAECEAAEQQCNNAFEYGTHIGSPWLFSCEKNGLFIVGFMQLAIVRHRNVSVRPADRQGVGTVPDIGEGSPGDCGLGP